MPGARKKSSQREHAKSKTRRERSAGVVAWYRADADTPPRFLLLDYGRYWDYPKGHLEAGEDDTTAARRELREETGLTEVTLDPDFSREITYYFKKGSRLIHKSVVFFLGRSEQTEVQISHEHVGYRWAELDEAFDLLGHANARAVLQAAAEHLAPETQGS